MHRTKDRQAKRTTKSVSILLAEPNLLLKEKIAGVLARHEGVWCVVQVSRKLELVRAVARLSPDFILADLPLLMDPETIEILRVFGESARIFALVDTSSGPYSNLGLRLGLDGLIEKSRVGERIFREIEQLRAEREAADAPTD
jgi:DNA-binding NarL/FixJ family response regulator